ncbi:MAG: glycosyltransferase family 2 protein [Actinobacteria bacterium]|nr:glycosyltransferase family 2 protein [Actinomycetota bacterium]
MSTDARIESSGGRRALYIVVPVYNEAPNLERLFEGLRAAAREAAELDVSVVLVDDGSADGTPDLARALAEDLELTVLTHGTNRGPGYAFGTAFAHLASRVRPHDLVVTMEGDNTSRTELIGKMLRRAEEGHDAVFASPYAYGGGILHTRASRVVLSHIANAFVKEFIGVHGILTVSSFFRLYRGSSLLRLQESYGERVVERDGFESMVELVMKMAYLQMSISEVPMVLDGTRRVGKSKMSTRRTVVGYLSLFGRKRAWQRRSAKYPPS